MSVAHLYTDFGGLIPRLPAPSEAVDIDVEEAQLTGFESGYQAGWDDAVKAKEDENQKLTSELVQRVQDMSFTYHEAYSKVTTGLRPLMSQIATSLLPPMAKKALEAHLQDQVGKLLKDQSHGMMDLVVPAGLRPEIEELFTKTVGVPFTIAEDPTLGGGQVYMSVNQQEREIDLDAMLADINAALDAFFHRSEQELNHG